MRPLLIFCMLSSLLGATSAKSESRTGKFDYYVLALTWMPAFCDNPRMAGRAMCARVKPRFIVHGLWPQNERGWPENCNIMGNQATDALLYDARDLYSSTSAALHQWKKHGSCSGLGAKDYFDLTRTAFAKINLAVLQSSLERRGSGMNAPRARRILIEANPGLDERMLRITTRRGMVEEARICLTPALTFRRCSP